ncbi:MAG: hypothetical protein Q8911_00270 [Bacillota bacterium]|nr:hypothetical protein [Bacillota bacterium]
MKHGKKPSLKQRQRIKAHGLNPKEWMVCKDCSNCFEIVQRDTGEVKKLKTREENSLG